jgi:hypothetical protein
MGFGVATIPRLVNDGLCSEGYLFSNTPFLNSEDRNGRRIRQMARYELRLFLAEISGKKWFSLCHSWAGSI